jgi:hypothetical protein
MGSRDIFPISRGMWTGSYRQEDLARFGYRSKRKSTIKKTNLAMYWRHVRTHGLSIKISTFFFCSKYGEHGGNFFSPQNRL